MYLISIFYLLRVPVCKKPQNDRTNICNIVKRVNLKLIIAIKNLYRYLT